MEARFKDFQTEYNLDDEAMAKILGLFNDAFIEIAHKLISDAKMTNKTPTKKTSSSKNTDFPLVKRWATKIAAEYAQENNLTLDDFDIETLKDGKVTKNDINTYLKANKLGVKKEIKKSAPVTNSEEEPWYKSPGKQKMVNKCCGMNKSGDPCKQPGTTKPEGANNFYCFRHGMDWKNFEVSSDSDLDEEPIEKEIVCAIVDSE